MNLISKPVACETHGASQERQSSLCWLVNSKSEDCAKRVRV